MRLTNSYDGNAFSGAFCLLQIDEQRFCRYPTSASQSRRLEELFRSRWHYRGMVIDYEPALAIVDKSKAVARREGFHFSILGVGESVVTAVFTAALPYTRMD